MPKCSNILIKRCKNVCIVQFTWISFPTSVDPVNATLLTSGWLTIAAPAVGPKPGITFTTPSGKPASFVNAATYSPVNGVCSASFITIVHPSKKTTIKFDKNVYEKVLKFPWLVNSVYNTISTYLLQGQGQISMIAWAMESSMEWFGHKHLLAHV